MGIHGLHDGVRGVEQPDFGKKLLHLEKETCFFIGRDLWLGCFSLLCQQHLVR